MPNHKIVIEIRLGIPTCALMCAHTCTESKAQSVFPRRSRHWLHSKPCKSRQTGGQAGRQTGRGDCGGQNVFRVPNTLCFTRLNSFADCHNTDLLLTQRKWPLSTTLKWPGGEHEILVLKIQQTIADSMFVRIWEGGKCVLDNLNGFGLNTTYFDS